MDKLEFHVAPPENRFFQKLNRRWHQFKSVIGEMDIHSAKDNLDRLHQRYDQEAEISFYKKFCFHGPWAEEDRAYRWVLRQSQKPQPMTALVVGCGTGREVIDLRKAGFAHVIGIDLNPRMIEWAQQQKGKEFSQTQFICGDFNQFSWPQKFDFIYISPGITGHIPKKRERIEFLKRCRPFLKPNGILGYEPEVLPFPIYSRYGLASKLLKLKGYRTEPGDTLRSFFGRHNNTKDLLFFHFYRDLSEFINELNQANFDEIHFEDDLVLAEARA